MSLSHSAGSARSVHSSRSPSAVLAVSVRASTPARNAHVRTRTRTRARTPIPKDEIEFRANRDNSRGEKEHEPYLRVNSFRPFLRLILSPLHSLPVVPRISDRNPFEFPCDPACLPIIADVSRPAVFGCRGVGGRGVVGGARRTDDSDAVKCHEI